MKTTATILAFLAAFTIGPATTFAGVSDWTDNPGGRMRLAVLAPDADGTVKGVIEIEPAKGWITYWREPGEAGMPPQMTLAPGTGLALEDLRFPPPRIFDQGGVRDIGYNAPVSLVFTLKGKAAGDTLKAGVFIGVCKEICVPFQADFNVPFTGDAAQEAEAKAALIAAGERLPEAPSADFFAEKPRIGVDAKTVTVPVGLPDLQNKPEFFLTGPDGYVYVEPMLERSGSSQTHATFALGELPRNYDLHGKTWRLLVKSGHRSMETTLVFD